MPGALRPKSIFCAADGMITTRNTDIGVLVDAGMGGAGTVPALSGTLGVRVAVRRRLNSRKYPLS
jgi:hypothetical protein